jgi:hypothetical protein
MKEKFVWASPNLFDGASAMILEADRPNGLNFLHKIPNASVPTIGKDGIIVL